MEPAAIADLAVAAVAVRLSTMAQLRLLSLVRAAVAGVGITVMMGLVLAAAVVVNPQHPTAGMMRASTVHR